MVYRIFLSHYMHQSSHFTTHSTFSHFYPYSVLKKFNLIQIYFTPFRKKIKGYMWSKFPTPPLCSWVHHDPPRLWPNFGRIPKEYEAVRAVCSHFRFRSRSRSQSLRIPAHYYSFNIKTLGKRQTMGNFGECSDTKKLSVTTLRISESLSTYGFSPKKS